MRKYQVCFALLACVLAACTAHPEQSGTDVPAAGSSASPRRITASPPSAPAYTDTNWNFSIDVPPDWKVEHDFAHGYLADGAWKTYAAPDSRGMPVISLTMPGSNQITSAELRIGASREANEIAHCATPPDSIRAGSLHSERIGNAQFITFEASDAAMSHYLEVKSFRAVHDGACYAIDLLVYGTNPQVYDPPPTPPFSKEQAFAKMHTVLQTFRFTR
ncbi:MAG TPA: hypothetical protein VJ727_08895 [Rhodanobacteraceae bacterium]|nr:hypothetical protein [Rhodanobacteraceae bacterium]